MKKHVISSLRSATFVLAILTCLTCSGVPDAFARDVSFYRQTTQLKGSREVVLRLFRLFPIEESRAVVFRTRDGTALGDVHFVPQEGGLVFDANGDWEQEIRIALLPLIEEETEDRTFSVEVADSFEHPAWVIEATSMDRKGETPA